ncbi:MAG: adenosylhomocysteinase [Lachnospiraceae bacterium]|nr:adenosylhomocysteinase [Lachnospiraceae bacterium]
MGKKMHKSEIRDIGLAQEGQKKIDWVRSNMPLLRGIEEEFRKEKPFAGIKVALSIHLEAKTAYLCHVLNTGGAEMYITGSNPLSTQDDVAAALVSAGMTVYAWHASTPAEYEAHIRKTVECGPGIVIDDGGDLVTMIHNAYPHLIEGIIGGCEETTTGILRLLAMDKDGALKFPMVLVNNAQCKHLFDNRYGTGQSVWDGINRTTNLSVSGKTVVVAGYGWCGKGVAMRAKGFGANVIVTEIDPVKAIEAYMDGFAVMEMVDAAPLGDIFVTVTGCDDVIGEKHFNLIKDGAVMCNAGHFDVEVNVAKLAEIADEIKEKRKNIVGYRLGDKWLNVLAEGRLVNLAAGDGHPAEIMDMSFAIQALSARYMVKNKGNIDKMIIDVPTEIDSEVALRKLHSLGITIDKLTEEQAKYLGSWVV